MVGKNPFDYSKMFSMFDPEKVAKMFDPAQLSAALDPKQFQQVDVSGLLETNKRNYESMVAANKAAASIYKSFYEKQMSIYTEVMGEAATQIQALQAGNAPDLKEQQSRIYDDAVKRSLQLMTDFATATQRANEDAFAVIKDRMKESAEEMKPKK